MSTLQRTVTWLSQLFPWAVDTDRQLDRRLAFLGVSVGPEQLVRAGYGAALLCVPVVACILGLVPRSIRPLVGSVGLLGIAALARGTRTIPSLLSTARRTRALGEAPALISRAALRMKITPAPEVAATFAAKTSEGPLADSLAEHVRRATGSQDAGFRRFASEWQNWFPALDRAVLLVASAGAVEQADREETLDRALDTVLDGVRDEMADFAADLKGPATALYAFGVVLPLALVALLPAARLSGMAIPLSAIVLVYDILLPGILIAASAWILVRRPVTFPPPTISRSHPKLPDRRWPAIAAGVVAGTACAITAAVLVAGWTVPLAAVGWGIGTALVIHYRPVQQVRDRIRAIEQGLSDALYHIGRRVADGQAVETAIESAPTAVTDEVGAVLSDAARRQRQLKIGVHETFLGEHGVLADVPSERTKSAATLLHLAAREGQPAGTAIVAMADHLGRLETIEQETRNEIATLTGTLGNTGAVFAPLVAGTTVALADGTASSAAVTTGGPGTTGLGLAVGWYTLVLAVVLTALATGLSRGLDRTLVGYRVGWVLLAATASYLTAVYGAGMLL